MAEKKAGKKRSARSTRRKKTVKKATRKATVKKTNPLAKRAMVIVNPVAGAGAVLKIWDDLQERLRELGLEFDYRFSEFRKHAVEIATDASKKGYGKLVVVGGDGTLLETVNGMMAVTRGKRPTLGVIPCGRGSDFCRTLDIPQDWQTAASLIVSGRKRTIDIGRMEYRTAEGVETGYFANIAGLGFDGEVTERANSFPELMQEVGGTASYFLSLGITFVKFNEKDVELHVDDEVYRVLAATVVVANGQYFGHKMRIAPEAVLDDGLFDVVVIGVGYGSPVLDLPPEDAPPSRSLKDRIGSKVKMAGNVPKLYRGTHVEDESIMVMRGSKVRILSDDRMVLQADGEVLGEGPLRAEVMPKALDVIA